MSVPPGTYNMVIEDVFDAYCEQHSQWCHFVLLMITNGEYTGKRILMHRKSEWRGITGQTVNRKDV